MQVVQYRYALHMRAALGGYGVRMHRFHTKVAVYKHTMPRALLMGTNLTVYLDAEVMESSPQNQQEPRGIISSTRLAWPDEYLLSNASHMI